MKLEESTPAYIQIMKRKPNYSTFGEDFLSTSHLIRYPTLLAFCVLSFSISWLSFTFIIYPVEYTFSIAFVKINLEQQNIPMLSYIIFSVPSLWIIHCYTIQQVICLSSILAFIGALLRYLLFQSHTGVIISSMLCSVSLTIISPIPSLIAVFFFREDERAKAIALEVISFLLGIVLALPLKVLNNNNMINYLSTYLATQAAFSFLVMILVWKVMHDVNSLVHRKDSYAKLGNWRKNKSFASMNKLRADTMESIPEVAKKRGSLLISDYGQSTFLLDHQNSDDASENNDYSAFDWLDCTTPLSSLNQSEMSLLMYSDDLTNHFDTTTTSATANTSTNQIQAPTFCTNVCNYFTSPILFHFTISYGTILSVLFSMIKLSFFETRTISFPLGAICCFVLATLLDSSVISLDCVTHSVFISCALSIISFYLYPQHLIPKAVLGIIFIIFLFLGYIYSSMIKLTLDGGTIEVQNRFSTGVLIYFSIVFYWIITYIFQQIFKISDNDNVIGWIHVALLTIVCIWFTAGVTVD